ncbi:MAG: hypothetical protein KKF56_03155 [Nanoarchaeota archaeon]|nr:hypothetical protein [Nanoarchaeota archaeon]
MKNNKLIYIGLIVVLVIAAIYLYNENRNLSEQISDQDDIDKDEFCKPDKDWLIENCECIERNHIVCPEGFEVVGDFCLNETQNQYTSRLLKCSKYQCPPYSIDV